MAVPSFRFRLERLRSLREHREDAAKEALAGALAVRSECEDRLRTATDRLDQARAAQLNTSTANASDLLARQAYLERTEHAADATRCDLEQRELEVESRRDQLAEAARDREALERLRDQQRSDHELEANRVESQALDEIAINAFRRRAA